MKIVHRGFSWRRVSLALAASSIALFGFAPGVRVADAQTTYGTLSNFDVVNDTGQPCHGFEIELEGISRVRCLTPLERPTNGTVTL